MTKRHPYCATCQSILEEEKTLEPSRISLEVALRRDYIRMFDPKYFDFEGKDVRVINSNNQTDTREEQ